MRPISLRIQDTELDEKNYLLVSFFCEKSIYCPFSVIPWHLYRKRQSIHFDVAYNAPIVCLILLHWLILLLLKAEKNRKTISLNAALQTLPSGSDSIGYWVFLWRQYPILRTAFTVQKNCKLILDINWWKMHILSK